MRWILLLLSPLALAEPALAYIGPGAGLGAIGVLIAIIGGVLLLLIGFLWYPLKRLTRRWRNPKKHESQAEDE